MAKTAEELRALERSLAYEAASGALEGDLLIVEDDEGEWRDLNSAEDFDKAAIEEAVEYLESRAPLVRHAGLPNLVQVLDEDSEG